MLTIELRGPNISNSGSSPGKTIWFGGQPNPLSGHPLSYPSIERIHAATKLLRDTAVTEELPKVAGEIPLPQPARSRRPFGEVVRTRRSALDFAGGSQSITLPQLSAILATIRIPFSADFIEHRVVQLYLYVHRVDALPRGVYRYCLDRDALELIRSGDQRVATAGLSLGQDLAGNACLAFSMIADLERAARMYGDRAYRYAHFEAGAIGQRLYLAAESLGLRGTGMGAFFDDEVHRYLGLTPEVGQVVYHFAIGYPVDDPRLDA
jgi:SagB-type dehydrogenase family enzyme